MGNHCIISLTSYASNGMSQGLEVKMKGSHCLPYLNVLMQNALYGMLKSSIGLLLPLLISRSFGAMTRNIMLLLFKFFHPLEERSFKLCCCPRNFVVLVQKIIICSWGTLILFYFLENYLHVVEFMVCMLLTSKFIYDLCFSISIL